MSRRGPRARPAPRRSMFERFGPALMETYPGLTVEGFKRLTIPEFNALMQHIKRRNAEFERARRAGGR